MIIIGADHNGFALKEMLKTWLVRRGERIADVRVRKKSGDDYPAIAVSVAKRVAAKKGSVGILVCGSGNGMAMAANRFRTIRAALCWNVPSAKKAREDEDANIVILPAWWVTIQGACSIVHMFLKTKFSGASRHRRRIRQLHHLYG